jgi:homoserine O-succinyltransferase/O-acetyltransferase
MRFIAEFDRQLAPRHQKLKRTGQVPVAASRGCPMPVIIDSSESHPFLPSLSSVEAIERGRALHQDIRPIEIAILNLMADKPTTERQLAMWLGHTPLQIKLTFVATDDYIFGVRAGRETKTTSSAHIKKFYRPFGEISTRKFDGLIVTGVNALKPRVGDETFWPDVQHILDWSTTHVLSSVFLCWGAKAALKHFHDIESLRAEQKLFGLFTHRRVSDRAGLMFGMPDEFDVPVSRWKSPSRDDIQRAGIEILADSVEAGPNMLAEAAPYNRGASLYPRRVYILNHPEYETETLGDEYRRDAGQIAPPRHYFVDGDVRRTPLNRWRHIGFIYTNWIKALYDATPYNIGAVPNPFEP